MEYLITAFDHKRPREVLEQSLRKALTKDGDWLLHAQMGLSNSEYWLVLQGDGRKPDGSKFEKALEEYAANRVSFTLEGLEPDVPWFRTPGKLYHMESFGALIPGDDLAAFMTGTCLPYWRKCGAHAKIFRLAGDERTFFLMTQMDNMGSMDGWSSLAAEEEGKQIFGEFIAAMDYARASIFKDIT